MKNSPAKLSCKTIEVIRNLAKRYENAEFLKSDPSQFMHRHSEPSDIEVVALLSACLAYGKRSESLRHIQQVIDNFGNISPTRWCLADGHHHFFPQKDGYFYRIFTYDAMRLFFKKVGEILRQYGSLGACLQEQYRLNKSNMPEGGLGSLLANLFPDDCSPLVPKTTTSANKRLNLFLRWMVRNDSPVDMGLWQWYPKQELLMPLDTHVVAVAKSFTLLPPKANATLRNAILLTEKMRGIFPDDPVKGDYALFGYGVEQDS